MNVRVLEMHDNGRRMRLLLPLGHFTRNRGGSMFGGAVASVADPMAAIACSRVFPGFAVWTRAMDVDFINIGNTDLEFRFDFAPDLEQRINEDLQQKGRSTPSFEITIHRSDGTLCARVINTVAIRPRGYRKPAKIDRRTDEDEPVV